VTPKRRPFGVDFSGARSAGKAIWIAEGRLDGKRRVALVDCYPALALPDSGPERALALAALRRLIATTPDGVFGCDFPVGLPRALLQGADWKSFIADFDRRHAHADAFRAACRRIANGKEIRRDSDRLAKTPFCAWNLRLYRQTYHGIAEIVAPLHRDGHASVISVEQADPDRAWIAETCPASVLKFLGLYRPYKGKAPPARKMRREILAALVERDFLAPPSRSQRERLVEDRGGDALDSVVACLAAASAIRQLGNPMSAIDRIEGKVFFEL
jgi:uncharacterized protein DUF429